MAESEDEISAEALAQIVAEMTGSETRPVSAEDKEKHELFMAEARARHERERIERERRRAEAAEAERAQYERQAHIDRAERTKQLNDELIEKTRRQTRDRSLTEILNSQVEQRAFRQQALRAAANKAARDRLKNILNPPPAPEPTVVVVSEDDGSADLGSRNFDVAKWAKKPRSWW